jgi:hypothetical protein
MDDYGDALEPLQQLIKELTPDGAWLFGPEGKALAKLPLFMHPSQWRQWAGERGGAVVNGRGG